MNADETVAYVDHFQRRVLQDAISNATSAYWERRARQFAAVGTRECNETAAACRNAAAFWADKLEQVICPVCGTPTSPWTCSCGETRVGAIA